MNSKLIKFLVFFILVTLIFNFGLLRKKINAIGPPTEVWVDDDGPDNGYDHFDTIQEGINGVANGGIVHVAAGTYSESVIINKSVHLIGDPGDLTTPGCGNNAPIVDGSSFTYKSGFNIINNISNVIIEGFKIQNFKTPAVNTNCNGITAWVITTNNIIIRYNYFYDLGYAAILTGNGWGSLQGIHDNWKVEYNKV